MDRLVIPLSEGCYLISQLGVHVGWIIPCQKAFTQSCPWLHRTGWNTIQPLSSSVSQRVWKELELQHILMHSLLAERIANLQESTDVLSSILVRRSSKLSDRVEHIKHHRLELEVCRLYLRCHYPRIEVIQDRCQVISNCPWSYYNFSICCSILILKTLSRQHCFSLLSPSLSKIPFDFRDKWFEGFSRINYGHPLTKNLIRKTKKTKIKKRLKTQ